MIRNGFHFGLIHRLGAFAGECSARWHGPVFRRLDATASGAHFDAAGIDSQLGFAAGQISLRIDGAFCRQVLEHLRGLEVANDDQLAVRILLQVLGYVVKSRFARIVHAPRLHRVREVALAQLARLRRRRRRILHHHLRGCGRRLQTARVGTSCAHRDWTGGRACRTQHSRIAAAGDAAAARGPVAYSNGNILRTGASATDGGRRARQNCRRVR